MDDQAQREQLEQARIKIDSIDEQILRLLNDRADLADHIADLKLELSMPIYDPEREEKLLERLKSINKDIPDGYLPNEAVDSIFKGIIENIRQMEMKKLKYEIIKIEPHCITEDFSPKMLVTYKYKDKIYTYKSPIMLTEPYEEDDNFKLLKWEVEYEIMRTQQEKDNE